MPTIRIEFTDDNTSSTLIPTLMDKVGKRFITKNGGIYVCKEVVLMDNGTKVYITQTGEGILGTNITCWEIWNSK